MFPFMVNWKMIRFFFSFLIYFYPHQKNKYKEISRIKDFQTIGEMCVTTTMHIFFIRLVSNRPFGPKVRNFNNIMGYIDPVHKSISCHHF